jgi:hypothetical protein
VFVLLVQICTEELYAHVTFRTDEVTHLVGSTYVFAGAGCVQLREIACKSRKTNSHLRLFASEARL